ncbi:MAG TPA: transcription-repair coupling factor, partial [Flavipsychrobacter sp.]|nr:transcription-repair coupling factor [Flavipsychrobacter sp.]
MNLNVLLEQYYEDDRIKKIAGDLELSQPNQHYQFTNLYGGAFSIIATALWHLSTANHLFILNDKEEAAYFHNDLEHLTKALDICFFPDSYKKTGSFKELNSSHIMLRTEALTKFSNQQAHKKALVTYPEALFEKVVNP